MPRSETRLGRCCAISCPRGACWALRQLVGAAPALCPLDPLRARLFAAGLMSPWLSKPCTAASLKTRPAPGTANVIRQPPGLERLRFSGSGENVGPYVTGSRLRFLGPAGTGIGPAVAGASCESGFPHLGLGGGRRPPLTLVLHTSCQPGTDEAAAPRRTRARPARESPPAPPRVPPGRVESGRAGLGRNGTGRARLGQNGPDRAGTVGRWPLVLGPRIRTTASPSIYGGGASVAACRQEGS